MAKKAMSFEEITDELLKRSPEERKQLFDRAIKELKQEGWL